MWWCYYWCGEMWHRHCGILIPFQMIVLKQFNQRHFNHHFAKVLCCGKLENQLKHKNFLSMLTFNLPTHCAPPIPKPTKADRHCSDCLSLSWRNRSGLYLSGSLKYFSSLCIAKSGTINVLPSPMVNLVLGNLKLLRQVLSMRGTGGYFRRVSAKKIQLIS